MNGHFTHRSNAFEPVKIEFSIPYAGVLRKPSLLSYIESLFEVSVSAPGSQGHGVREWVALRGKQEQTAKAKKYIIALCIPDVRSSYHQPSFARLLFSEGVRMRRELEREFQAVLSPGEDGLVLIQGAESDVYNTEAKLKSLINTSALRNGHSLNHPPVTVATHAQPTTSGREMLPDAQVANIPLRGARTNSVIPRGSGDISRENRVKYFVNLGYSREMVESVLGSLPNAADDIILNRLVQCTPPQRVLGGDDPVPIKPVNPELLRHIVIDGSNVAMKHGNGLFSCKGIQLAVDYFKQRGHSKITVFVPEWRKEAPTIEHPITDQYILRSLEFDGHLKYTPSRRLAEGRRIVCYDDRFIIKLATDEQGVIVSNDQYRDLVKEKVEWKEVIETRLLQFTFANDYFMPPDDPLGRNGPSLDQLLSTDPLIPSQSLRSRRLPPASGQQPCPFAERCTFGRKCKYWHPEREASSSNPSTASHTPSTSRSPTPSPSPDKRHMGRSREDLVKSGGYHDNQISLPELNERMSQISMHNRPESINLGRLDAAYPPPQVMRSTPSLPTPQDPSHQAPYEGSLHPSERRSVHHRTFPLLTLPPTSAHHYERRYTEDLSHHHTVTPSHHHRAHTHEHEHMYDQQQWHLTGFPGPQQQPRPNSYGLLPRDGSTPLRQQISPQHYPRPPPHTPSHRIHGAPPTSHSPLYDEKVFKQALSVLPGCEDRLHRVFTRYPRINSYEEAVDIARRIN